MKKIFSVLFFLFLTSFVRAQSEQLAQNYFDRGEFEKALVSYEALSKAQPTNLSYSLKMAECYQQLSQFDKSEKLLQDLYDKYKQSNFLVELGYNFQLQKNLDKAKKYFDQAVDRIKKNSNEVYQVAYAFEHKTLVDYALQSYQTALSLDSKFNFNFQMAVLYGQKGDVDTMIDLFLNESFRNPQNLVIIQSQLSRFMIEDTTTSFNETLKKALLLRIQKSQDIFWNEFLSWFFVQLKEYGKAFVQQKAIYKRNPESFSNIINLGQLAIAENDSTNAVEILSFVLENTSDLDLQIQCHSYLMDMKIKKATAAEYPSLSQELDLLIKKYGVSPYSLSLLKLKAHFLAFYLKRPEEGKEILKNALEIPINREQIAYVKMELADILLFEEKFNQALIYYSQIESEGNNSPMGQEANLKIAKTSYYRGDFKWANHQLEVLKSASTQLIANDALDLFLLISDNTVEDSTQVALKKFSRADFLLFQDKKQDALAAFQAILKENKGDAIEPVTLLRIGKIYESKGDTTSALVSYKQIIDNFKECIYIDEALFYSAELYYQTNDFDKANPLYEELITKHEDSIYYVTAQKRYRKLRGDKEI
ncbi:tetratricopeptide repeat protein [Flavobacterium aciduliphilum]|uniref:Tetratricopeptide repeat protein n=1 Tax=Flavobacterium aciduliphilum TaxID=1101402 RepID=A0A328YFL1_9FLAO|nr:tetratricopeptide repeat protein [Flavobacterium aciduliphilum]RAR72808.1 tetratricopeptide repeat protein [Flavobacterium aciduliphilum]